MLAIVAFIALMMTAVPATTYAMPHGNAWGYYGMAPGHMMQRDRFEYQWNNQEFSDIDSLREYIREYIRMWSELHGQGSDNRQAEIQVTTNVATSIKDDRATLGGVIDLDDADYAYVWFEYGDTASDLDETTARLKLNDAGEQSFEATVTGLDEGKRYYFRAVGEDDDDDKDYGIVRSFVTDEDSDDDENTNDDEPEVSTNSVQDIEDTSAELRGDVRMNDFDNGIVFFVYGEDRDLVEEVADEYGRYADIDEEGDDLQKVLVDNDLDSNGAYVTTIGSLDADTTYYVAIGLQYEDEDGDEVISLGTVRSFRTDR